MGEKEHPRSGFAMRIERVVRQNDVDRCASELNEPLLRVPGSERREPALADESEQPCARLVVVSNDEDRQRGVGLGIGSLIRELIIRSKGRSR